MSASDIKSLLEFKCTDQNEHDFLNTLTGFGFLNRKGLLDTAMYSNSIDSDFFGDGPK